MTETQRLIYSTYSAEEVAIVVRQRDAALTTEKEADQ